MRVIGEDQKCEKWTLDKWQLDFYTEYRKHVKLYRILEFTIYNEDERANPAEGLAEGGHVCMRVCVCVGMHACVCVHVCVYVCAFVCVRERESVLFLQVCHIGHHGQ